MHRDPTGQAAGDAQSAPGSLRSSLGSATAGGVSIDLACNALSSIAFFHPLFLSFLHLFESWSRSNLALRPYLLKPRLFCHPFRFGLNCIHWVALHCVFSPFLGVLRLFESVSPSNSALGPDLKVQVLGLVLGFAEHPSSSLFRPPPSPPPSRCGACGQPVCRFF